jgi:hypothetical protein
MLTSAFQQLLGVLKDVLYSNVLQQRWLITRSAFNRKGNQAHSVVKTERCGKCFKLFFSGTNGEMCDLSDFACDHWDPDGL